MTVKPYSDKKANGLTKAIIDFINFSGGTAISVSTTGTMRRVDGQMKWTFGNTRRGTADIQAVIVGRHVSIEVKTGGDRLSAHQHQERKKIESAGGVFVVATDFPAFHKSLHEYFPGFGELEKRSV